MKIGVLGAGQLGRMLALAGLPLEMQFSFYDTSGAPSVGIGNVFIDQGGTGKDLDSFLADVDIVTSEFEHIPLDLARKIESRKMLLPSSESTRVCQNRGEEKRLFTKLGIPTPKYHLVDSLAAFESAVEQLGCPVVAKTVTDGYDGKGQAVIRDPADVASAWNRIGNTQLIVEKFVNFSRELSIIAVRSKSGQLAFYPLTENTHHEGILRYSVAPAPRISPELDKQAQCYIGELLEALNHVGILTLELFETEQGLLANEMAPRVHNSGHWSIEGANCSQFENHLRAIADLPLGDCQAQQPTCMINIISEKGDIQGLLRLPYAHIHLYGKDERKGRKLGHVTVQADSYKELTWRIRNVAAHLPGSPEYHPTENR
ncbi:MAG: 5-(carboxyamino)imidazole ribonucleotide synthase [Hahellaceae bacterium]|nr:5-(carboxyamino)imidazole ribonucleotide synthase [Hahellaceae bacterium]